MGGDATDASPIVASPPPPPPFVIEDRAHKVLVHFMKAETVAMIGMAMGLFMLYVLFFGMSFQPANYLVQIRARVVDLDGSLVGSMVSSTIAQVGRVTWSFHNASDFPTLADVQADVDQARCWFAIVVQPNATVALQAALASYTPAYNPRTALALIFDEGRAAGAMSSLLLPLARNAVTAAQSAVATFEFNQRFSSQNLTTAAWLTPIAATEINLHPNLAPVGSQVVSLGLMYSLIFSMLLFALGNTGAEKLVGLARPSYILFARTVFYFLGAILIALMNSISVLIYNGTFVNGTFGGYFGWLLFCALSFGSVGAVLQVFPSVLANLLTLVFIIVNSSSGAFALPLELSSPFYYIGYGLPLWNAGTGIRTIMFGAHDVLWINSLVLLAWGVPCFVLSNILQHRKFTRLAAKRRAAAHDEKPVTPQPPHGSIDDMERGLYKAGDHVALVSAAGAGGAAPDGGVGATAAQEMKVIAAELGNDVHFLPDLTRDADQVLGALGDRDSPADARYHPYAPTSSPQDATP